MKNISEIKDCYGCGVCVISCPKNIINLELNKDGFYAPKIYNLDKCINCGLCLKNCAFVDNKVTVNNDINQIKSFAVWSKDESIRYDCSSGGAAFEIGAYLIDNGYLGCSVKYDSIKNRAEHYIAKNKDEYKLGIGSKYIQSYTIDAFSTFDSKNKYVVTGTPCQIDSLRKYIRFKKIEENFVLIDFFCHGVPSILLWSKYLQHTKVKDISNVTWRNKKMGWHNSWAITLKDTLDNDIYFSLHRNGDKFYKMFLGHYCLGDQCHKNCKYKLLNSSSDIRLGDFWGKKYSNNQKGVSSLITFTKKGNDIISSIDNLEFIPETISVACEGQMKEAAKANITRPLVRFFLKTKMNLKTILYFVFIIELPFKVLKKINVIK